MFANKTEKRKAMTSNHLFCLDIDHIQDYIFNTNRLKTIAGASSIIDRLNNTETVNELKEYGFNDDPKSSDDFIYYAVRSEIG
ncbi:MAG: hypothetical protein B6I30_01950 [Desulfobacteraceae bacterium 4572_187]|nr:MAG: hypothetical protein B6I30_01950 [Desulfobacteraceae bacterium 4572_187]